MKWTLLFNHIVALPINVFLETGDQFSDTVTAECFYFDDGTTTTQPHLIVRLQAKSCQVFLCFGNRWNSDSAKSGLRMGGSASVKPRRWIFRLVITLVCGWGCRAEEEKVLDVGVKSWNSCLYQLSTFFTQANPLWQNSIDLLLFSEMKWCIQLSSRLTSLFKSSWPSCL